MAFLLSLYLSPSIEYCFRFFDPIESSIQLSRNSICSTVWNQCSPSSITVSFAPISFENSDIVKRLVRLSFPPYRILVGMCHSIGLFFTYKRYSQDKVSPN